MKDHGEDYESPATQDSAQDRGRKSNDDITGHPPIIITDDDLDPEERMDGEGKTESVTRGRDVIARFDAANGHHYAPEDPPVFTAGDLKEIDFIRVEDGTSAPHFCSNVPKHCRVVVSDSHRDTGNESTITIDATSRTRVVISFTTGEYRREHAQRNRKKLRSGMKKIRSLKVYNVAGELVHDCPEVRHTKNVRIFICDDCREQTS